MFLKFCKLIIFFHHSSNSIRTHPHHSSWISSCSIVGEYTWRKIWIRKKLWTFHLGLLYGLSQMNSLRPICVQSQWTYKKVYCNSCICIIVRMILISTLTLLHVLKFLKMINTSDLFRMDRMDYAIFFFSMSFIIWLYCSIVLI